MTNARLLVLNRGKIEVGIVPDIGGAVAYFRNQGRDIFYPMSNCAMQNRDAGRSAMFPMVPYANVVAGNTFEFAGVQWVLRPNNLPELLNLHGSGWKHPWNISAISDCSCLLELVHSRPEDPFVYSARLLYQVTESGLKVGLTVENIGELAMPFGLGLHPWFVREWDSTLCFSAARYFPQAPGELPIIEMDIPASLDFGLPRKIPEVLIDNAFGGWRGVASIQQASWGHTLEMVVTSVFSHLVFYSDPKKDSFCIEPQTHAIGALNMENPFSSGLKLLAPGESMGGEAEFRIGPEARISRHHLTI